MIFANIAKIAARIGAVMAMFRLITITLALVTFPALDYTFLTTAIGKAYLILDHWIPGFPIIWNFFLAMVNFMLAMFAARIAMFAYKVVAKIFI